MSLHAALNAREDDGRPVRVGIIGAGTFGRMFLAQVQRTAGMHVVAVIDRDVERARLGLLETGWRSDRIGARTWLEAVRTGTTWVSDDVDSLFDCDQIDVLIEATGNPMAGIAHALRACSAGFHIVMVNVEADALAGPLLAQKARSAGVVYSLASGDQPALICELVDWARTCGFRVVAAGKGTRFLPEYLASTPDTVWSHYGLEVDRAVEAGFNPQMFNSFLDGTKSSIELAAVANATGLTPPLNGLSFPPASVDELASVLALGGDRPGTVEVVSSLRRDGTQIERDLRWGVYVVFEAADDWVAARLVDYGITTDPTGRYAALYRPSHLIGLELGVSVASCALRGEATGVPSSFSGDVSAVAKRALTPGETLDGEGGYCVRGHLMPAERSLAAGALPIGLAHGVKVRRPVPSDAIVTWDDVVTDEKSQAVRVRREMEATFGARTSAGAASESNVLRTR